jgi:hypothetical protein
VGRRDHHRRAGAEGHTTLFHSLLFHFIVLLFSFQRFLFLFYCIYINSMSIPYHASYTIYSQVGDQLDRGAQEVSLLYFLERLQQEAAAAGGRFHVLNGNHETMNVQGRFNYAMNPGGLKDFHRWLLMQRFGANCKAACGVPAGVCHPGTLPPEHPEHKGLAAQAQGYGAQGLGEAWRARMAALGPGAPLTRRFFASHPVVLQVRRLFFYTYRTCSLFSFRCVQKGGVVWGSRGGGGGPGGVAALSPRAVRYPSCPLPHPDHIQSSSFAYTLFTY